MEKLLIQYSKENPEASHEVEKFKQLLEVENSLFRHQFTPGHFTASAFVLSPDSQKILLMHHQKLNKWLQPGGHCDGDADWIRVASREAEEETGVTTPALLFSGIFDLDIHEIPENKKEPHHFHYDVRFLFRALTLHLKQNHESKALDWFSFSEARALTKELSLLRPFDKIEACLSR